MTARPSLTANDLCARVLAAHPLPEWACFFEVRGGAGWDRRTADAIAMNLWGSRGLTVRGFEVKVDRRDLRRELANPAKAEEVARFCDEWWLVTPAGLVKDEGFDLPAGWGLMEAPDGEGLRTVRAAVRREAAPLTKGFVAQILKHAAKMIARENGGWVRRDEIAAELAEARAQGEACIPHNMRHVADRLAQIERVIADFKAGTGIDLAGGFDWQRDRGADVARSYRLGEVVRGRWGMRLRNFRDHVDHAVREITDLRERLDPLLALEEETKDPPTAARPFDFAAQIVRVLEANGVDPSRATAREIQAAMDAVGLIGQVTVGPNPAGPDGRAT